jgi:hypothetical protein
MIIEVVKRQIAASREVWKVKTQVGGRLEIFPAQVGFNGENAR